MVCTRCGVFDPPPPNVALVLQEELSRGQRLNESVFATGEPAILAENDINGSKISV